MSRRFDSIPIIDVDRLFDGQGAARDAVDAEIGRACEEIGFLVIAGRSLAPLSARERIADLLRFFDLSEAERRPLARQRYVAENANIYRGYFPVMNGERTFKEGIDIGPEFAEGDPRYPVSDPLVERNIWPEETRLPGWRREVVAYYADMEALGARLMQSLARHLGLAEDWFAPAFEGSNSTLRLLHYPVRTPRSLEGVDESEAFVDTPAGRAALIAGAHVDSGNLTILHQDGVGGLQAQNAAGEWVDVPPLPGSFVVNLGGALQRWTNDWLKATTHRVIGRTQERYSVPFFFEPAVDAEIACVPTCGAPRYAPVRYGDHVTQAMQRFVETRGVAVG
ncbi:MAG: 2OG-Fe(II) oxygenase family protein [Rhodovibrionaceae bacterium]|nr:2OG-Fe(II) oxygenase family protein [Rhodovibrionaceae bacterium]